MILFVTRSRYLVLLPGAIGVKPISELELVKTWTRVQLFVQNPNSTLSETLKCLPPRSAIALGILKTRKTSGVKLTAVIVVGVHNVFRPFFMSGIGGSHRFRMPPLTTFGRRTPRRLRQSSSPTVTTMGRRPPRLRPPLTHDVETSLNQKPPKQRRLQWIRLSQNG